MRLDPPNRYINLKLHELDRELGRVATDLLAGRRVGRRDTAYLLIAAARAISPDTAHPNSAARVVCEEAATPLEAFGPVLEHAQRTVRYWLINQAIDAAGGMPAGPARDRLLYMAMESDYGCRAGLTELSRTHSIHAKPPSVEHCQLHHQLTLERNA